jgi:radical SAM superfamily enzyme YgiQ (UPF0313 family)
MTYGISLVQTNELMGRNIRLPFSIGVLWQQAMSSNLNKDKWTLDHVVYKKLPIEELATQLAKSQLVCFSCYVWNFEYHMELALAIKRINPACYILVGGPHIHVEFPNFWSTFQHCVDLAIVGEGDHSFCQLLEEFPNHDIKDIPGAWTSTWFQGEAPRVTDLEALPSPYLAGFFDSIIAYEQSQGKLIEAMMQTNRGCPYHCTFCEQGKDYKNKMHFYSEERIRREIEWMGQKQIEVLDMADDNWGIHERDVRFMQLLCDTKNLYGYPKVFDATYAKNAPERILEMAKIDQSAGTGLIRGITFAYQSTNPTTLAAVKRFNLVPEKQLNLIQELKKLGSPTYAEMIWPLPYETYDSLLIGVDQTIDMGLDVWLEINLLRLPTSTDLHKKYQTQYEFGPSNDPAYLRPVSNTWLDHNTVVNGMVFYTWVTSLFYFGFGRPVLQHLKQTQSVSQSVDAFIKFTEQHLWLSNMTSLIRDFWSARINGTPEPMLGIFEQDTRLWLPFIHLASWLQKDFDKFKQHVFEFAVSQGLDQDVAKQLTDKCNSSTMLFEQSQFDNLFDFVEHYYAYNRKKGIACLTR